MLRAFVPANCILAFCCVLFNGTNANAAQQPRAVPPTTTHPSSATPQAPSTKAISKSVVQARVSSNYGKLPLSFEPNQGQTNGEVKFLSRGRGYTLFLTQTEAVFASSKSRVAKARPSANSPKGAQDFDRRSGMLRMKFVGSNPGARIEGMDELPGKANYFIGNDPKNWRTAIPTFKKVSYTQIYPGIDLLYYGNQRQLEFDFVVAPGADLHRIMLGIDHAHKLKLDKSGDLILQGPDGDETQLQLPHIYQELNGKRSDVRGRWLRKGRHEVGFEVPAYDHTRQLVVDPSLIYSTYLGGNNATSGNGIAVDASGNAFVAGWTESTDFPTTPGAFQTVPNANAIESAFVTKLNASGTSLIYSTYLGAPGFSSAVAVAIDSNGSAFVTGYTDSFTFPITSGAFQQTCLAPVSGTCSSAFVTKLSSDGSTLVYSSFLSGSGDPQGDGDTGYGIAVDSADSAYVTGNTTSTDFPTTAGSFQPQCKVNATTGTCSEAFVTKVNSSGSALVYSTYLGGSGVAGSCEAGRARKPNHSRTTSPNPRYESHTPANSACLNGDLAFSVALDSTGSAYLIGSTSSSDFPLQNPLQPTLNGSGNAFVTKFNAAGSALVYSTYLGGSSFDLGNSIAVDSTGNTYVAGSTSSLNFPIANAIQPSLNGTENGFVAKLNAAGNAFVYSTYLGGNTQDEAMGIAADSAGNAYVTGWTCSTNFPAIDPALGPFNSAQSSNAGNCDAFVASLNAIGNALIYSTYLGGTGIDIADGVALDSNGNAFVTGFTASTDFPTTQGAFQTAIAGAQDAFITELPFVPIPVCQTPITQAGLTINPDVTCTGDFSDGGNVLVFWGDDSFIGSGGPPPFSPTHTYTGSGTFTVVLQTTDSTGLINSVFQVVTVAPISVTVNPNTAAAQPGQTKQFTATVNFSTVGGVTWTLTGPGCSGNACGTVNSLTANPVTYTAPSSIPSPATVTLTATSVADPTKFGSANITISGQAVAVTISPNVAAVQTGTSQQFQATVQNNSNQNVKWSLSGSGCNGAPCGTIDSNTANPVTYSAPAKGSLLASGSQLDTLTVTAQVDTSVSVFARITDYEAPQPVQPPPAQTVAAGQTATYPITIAPNTGITTEPTTLSCSGLPNGVTFTFTPPVVTFGSTSTSFQLSLKTTGQTGLLTPPSSGSHRWLYAASIPFFGMFFLGTAEARRRRVLVNFVAFVLLASLLLLSGCGTNGSFGTPPPSSFSATPAGTYTIVVLGQTATQQSTGAFTVITNVTVTVQ